MSNLNKKNINPVTIQFITKVSILDELYSQNFGYKEEDRLALCPLAQSIMDFPKMTIGSVKLEKAQNTTGTIITIRSKAPAFTKEQIKALEQHVEHRLKPMQIAAQPLIDETALKARLEQDEFVPDENNMAQIVFADRFNEHTLPGVRAHGGYLKVKSFIDKGPNNEFSVELIAYGSCMQCGSAGTLTLSQLQRLESQMFEEMSDVVDNRKFGSIYVYEESNPDKLSYTVKADGIYDASNKRTMTFPAQHNR